jgi:hypothetical protein
MQENTTTYQINSASAQLSMPLIVSGASETATKVKVSIAYAKVRVQIDVFAEGESYIPSNELLEVSVTRRRIIPKPMSEAYQTMLASEMILRRDWDRPEEDEAWADL